jgi:O-Antigen ligase
MSRRVAARNPGSTENPGFGASRFLALYVALLFVIPARLIVPGTGALGAPATLVSLVAFGWWIAATIIGDREFVARNPVRTALFAYLAVVLASWTLGKTRPLTPIEASSSDRALLTTFGLAGIALVVLDGLRTRDEVLRLIDWIIRCSMVMVFVGLVQFFFKRDLTSWLELPGLQLNTDERTVISARSIFNRPHGTTLHAIEYGVVSAALIPLAYWLARLRRTPRAYLPVVALSFAAMTSISRSAVLAAAVVGLVVVLGSSWQQRGVILLCSSVFVVVVGTLVNGLVGTLRSLFTSADTDPSVQARIDRVPRVLEMISEHPWFGRGYGTYTLEDDFLLDNEIQRSAIEMGFVGVAILILFIGFVATMAWRTRFGGESGRLLGTALAATMLGLFVSSYTFDAFYYRILMGVLFLCVGITGAMYRLTATERAAADARWSRMAQIRLRPGAQSVPEPVTSG